MTINTNNYYSKMIQRNIGLLTREQQKSLRNSRVAVFGMGGLGGVAAELLVRTGIEKININDIDRFEPSNLNRQAFCFRSTLKKRKIDAAEKFLKDINPHLNLKKFQKTNASIIEKMLTNTNVAVLAIDQPAPCIHISRVCRRKGIPVVESVAMPYLNVRVYTKDSISFEDFFDYPTKDKSDDELYDLDDETMEKVMINTVHRFTKHVSGVKEHYTPEAQKLFYSGYFSTFGPIVWMQASFMALETLKIILKTGNLSVVPDYSLFDPFTHTIPEKF